MTFARPLLIILIFSFFLPACGGEGEQPQGRSGSTTGFENEATLAFYHPSGDTLTTITVDIAETDAERQRGLMRQRSLGYERGMLFIFDEVSKGGMWMKNTPLPLDIVFVAPDSQIVNIARRTTPLSEKSIEPKAPRKFVVEVRAGFADHFGLTDSTRVHWTRTQ